VAPSSSQELSGIQAQAAMAENDVGETVQTLKLAWISEGANKSWRSPTGEKTWSG
jgi:hypothetical protein